MSDTQENATEPSAPALTPARRRGTATLLVVSLACNVAVLFAPFMQLRIGLGSSDYTLMRSVQMLWDSGLGVLAILVFAFSVVFPFAKLGVLSAVTFSSRVTPRHQAWLANVERAGKWSMLDVFLVCLILTLTSGQMLVGAEPRVGIPLFVAAILLSLTAGEVLSVAVGRHPVAPRGRPSGASGFWLAFAGLALAAAVSLPFLSINDWLLANRSYSIATLGATLAREGGWLPALLAWGFLIVTPLLHWTASLRWWRRMRRGEDATAAWLRRKAYARWSMLDVFGLALAIFLVEGDYLMKTEVRWGALLLVASLALKQAFDWALDHAAARGVPDTR
ncbi:MAG: paraquat-inducible protein A [Burkholderiales bacterium]|nr:paraquat-inducible protein A [Opitutaceae bacterium]